MTLHTKILDAARAKVANLWGYDSWKAIMQSTHKEESFSKYHTEAALLAMEKQADFFRHIFFIGWRVVDNIDEEPIYEQGKQGPQQTELELYEIFTTQQ